MTTERDVFLAILALDSYNRGYNVGMDVGGTQISSAVITNQDYTAEQEVVAIYATVYSWNGETVISYRGTTFELGAKTQPGVAAA